jgi:hypothetical protein
LLYVLFIIAILAAVGRYLQQRMEQSAITTQAPVAEPPVLEPVPSPQPTDWRKGGHDHQ